MNNKQAIFSMRGGWIGALMLCALLSGCYETLPMDKVYAEPGQDNVLAWQIADPAFDDPTLEAPLPWPPSQQAPPPQEAAAPRKLYEWHGDGRKITRIVVDTNEQRAVFYDGNEVIGWSTVATGLANHPTPTGEFEVIEKVVDKYSNLYGRIYNRAGRLVNSSARQGRDPIPAGGRFAGSPMPHWMRMTHDGIGIHAGPIPRPGSPASHGCIRLPNKMAETVYQHTPMRTQVTVVGNGPDYGNYAERLRQQRDERIRQRQAAQLAEAAAPDSTADSLDAAAYEGGMFSEDEVVD